MTEATEFKSGFVGVVGPTNAGKSTLVNTVIGHKVSIVSSKVQTTYHGVKGILTTPRMQIVFIDTPGFQNHREKVAQLLNKVADKNAREADILVWVFDATSRGVVSQVEALRERIQNRPSEKSICILNKVDQSKKDLLLPMIKSIFDFNLFSDIIPLSAKTGDGVARLLQVLEAKLPPGIKYFPEDMITDRTQQFLVAEIVREKIYAATKQEIPYSAWVEIEAWETEGKMPVIRAVLHVDAASRKGILIGKGGEMLKRIGTEARVDIEKMVGHQVCLKLHVDVETDWRRDPRQLGRYLELS